MYIEVAAHRGNVALYPENTMPAFKSAFEIGADMIELDLHMTKDGEIVIIHDDNLARTTDKEGFVRDLTVEEIKRADAGIKKGAEFSGLRVPTLREFLEFVSREDNSMTFNFEFKDYFKVDEEFAKISTDKAITLIDEYSLWDRSIVNSFDGALLSYVEEKYDGRFRLHGFYPYDILGPKRPKTLTYASLWRKGTISPLPAEEDFQAVIADGVQPWVGAAIRSLDDMIEAAHRGAKLITSNEPEFMMNGLKAAGLREKE